MFKVGPEKYLTQSWECHKGLFMDSRLSGLGLTHGLTGRSLGDMKDVLNRHRALKRAGLKDSQVLTLSQIHSTVIFSADSVYDGQKGDAWISREAGKNVGVFVADCLPIFIFSPQASIFEVVHAGWRGVSAGMPAKAILELIRQGAKKDDIFVSVGPHIGSCCYEVGREVASRFRKESTQVRGRKLFLDLGMETFFQMTSLGVLSDHIRISKDCTFCQKENFFSFRRERKMQRMLAFGVLNG